jgi:hypothetical protein
MHRSSNLAQRVLDVVFVKIPLEPHPRRPPALLGRVLCHVFVLLQNLVDMVRGFQLGYLTILPVFLGELLDSPPTDLELLGDDLRVHVMIDNSPTDPGNIVLVKLHFPGLIVGQIVPTKSLADTTVHREEPTQPDRGIADTDSCSVTHVFF